MLTNNGSQPLVWNGFTSPGGPFAVSNLPAVGQSLASGASVSVTVQYAPTTNGNFSGSLDLRSSGGDLSISCRARPPIRPRWS